MFLVISIKNIFKNTKYTIKLLVYISKNFNNDNIRAQCNDVTVTLNAKAKQM